MICKTCEPDNFNTFIVTCKVCELVDNDISAKGCTYCDTCKAYICQSCYNDPIKRGKAILLNWGRKIIDLF